MARRAGMKVAESATAQSRIATEEKVSASVLVTPSNKLRLPTLESSRLDSTSLHIPGNRKPL